MLDELRRLSWAPRSFFNKLRRLEKAVAELSANLGREPTVNELAEKLSLSEKAVEQIFAEINKKSLLSLEELLFYNLESRLESGEPMGKDAGPEERLLQKERKELLARAIDTLSERERLILALYYYEKLTLKEIAGVMALSAPRISQLHARALIKMRNFLKKQG
jgi:RNA polymerase sigma factor for flagellar operon FliA